MKRLSLCLLIVFLSGGFCFAQSDQIESLKYELANARHDTSRVRLMVLISFNYRNNEIDSAMYYGQKALELASKIDFLKGKVQAMNRVAFSYRISGNLSKGLELSFRSLQLTENHVPEGEITEALTNIGSTYGELGDYPKALSYLKRGKLLLEKTNRAAGTGYGFIMMTIGIQFDAINQLDSAEYYYQKSLKTYIENKSKVHPGLYEKLGNVQFKKGNMPLALSYYQKSVKALNKTKNIHYLSDIFLALSKFYDKINKSDSSLYYAHKALNEARLISSKNKRIIWAATHLSKLYEKNNIDEAFRYYKIAVEIKDSIYGSSSLEAIQTIVSQEEERKKEIEANRIKYQNQLKQYALLTGLAVFLIIAIILYRNNQSEKKAKQILQEKNEEINIQKDKAEKALTELKSTQAQLIQSEKLASLGELTAGIAHEIQNPLNFVNNFSELSVELIQEIKSPLTPEGGIRDGDKMDMELIEDVIQNLEKINLHGKRASSIVSGMLEHSKVSTGERALTDINKLADEYLRLSYHGMRAKDPLINADYELITDPDLPKIEVIPQDIGRVLLNLINNAFWAVKTVEKPLVVVKTQHTDSQLIIKVIDNGTGMTDEVKAKVFQPFFTTKPTGQGTGLGLSLAYDIVTKGHGGTLQLESEEGEGSDFIITLPLKNN